MPKIVQKPATDHSVAANDTMDTASIKCNDVLEKLNEMCHRKGDCQRWMGVFLQKFTGHPNIMDCFCSFEQLVRFMYQPCDAASLGIGRMMFGLMMLIDIPDERSGGDLDVRWGDTRDCRFPLFSVLRPMSMPRMGIVYTILWLGALGITVGYKFRLSCAMFVVPYWYIFLLDKSSWNNHSYLYGLLGILFSMTDANRFCSLDSWRSSKPAQTVPFFNYFLLKFQFFILYFLAGAKKFSVEWLSGYAMTNLSYHWVFYPFRTVLGPELTDFLIVHQFGCIFDLTVAFFLIYKPTRPLATLFACSFHLMNSRLFNIGMFPWTCIVLLPLYYSYSWPRVVWQRFCFWRSKTESSVLSKDKIRKKVEAFTSVSDGEGDSMVRRKRLRQNSLKTKKDHISKQRKVVVALIFAYCALQLFLPYSHFITKGYNNWTNGLYGYSWDMMINAWDTVLVSIKIVDNKSATSHFLDPYVFAEQDRWTKHADMAHQYANCIAENLREDFRQNKQTILQSEDISIYFDVWCSMNGRFQQRMFNPNVDLLTARWHPFETTTWVLPLLEQYSQKRPELIKITKDVLSWNNFTDVLYIADFPGLSLENYIGPDLDNITLTVLEGKVVYRSASDNTSYPLNKGEYISVKAPGFHDVHTISKTPACYMYTFVNKTMQEKNETETPPKPMFPIVEELHARWQGYKRFFVHVANSFLYEIYGVPMPRRLRAVH